jgi:hypothetical protein
MAVVLDKSAIVEDAVGVRLDTAAGTAELVIIPSRASQIYTEPWLYGGCT